MAIAGPVSLTEYLAQDYKPARELIAGELVEKSMGTRKHMRMETWLELLLRRSAEMGFGDVAHELSVRHGDDVRIPDVVFYAATARFEDEILVDPPILCIETLSPSQRPSELFAKCEVYHAWDVPYYWVIDPIRKVAWKYHRDAPVRLIAPDGILATGEITVTAAEVFAIGSD